MNSKFVAASVLALAAMSSAGAFAQTHQNGEAALVNMPVAVTSNLTRSQVQADYLQARQNRTLPSSEESAFVITPIASNLLRSEVRAEAVSAARKFQEDGRNGS